MLNANSDDEYFTATSSSNLANLFGQSLQAGANPTLTYTAPKQPKLPETQEPPSSKPKPQNKLIIAKTVQLHHLVGSNYQYLGKFGIAIIGEPATYSYDLILYKTKQNILSYTKLNKSFQYIQNNEFSSYKDDQKQTYKVIFENPKDSTEFVKQLEKVGVVITQMENTKKVDEEEMPGFMSDSSGAHARASILDRISKVGQSMLPSKNLDLSESDVEEVVKTTKRPARKPKRHSSSEKDTVHSEFGEQSQQPQFVVPVPQTSSYQQYTLINGQYVPSNLLQNQLMQVQPQVISPLNDPLNIYFAENRTHNSEVRMNLSQLSNKLETVLSEIGNLKLGGSPSLTETEFLRGKVKELETKLEGISKKNEEVLVEKEMIIDNLKKEVEALGSKLNEKGEEDAVSFLLSKEIETLKLKLKDFEEFFEENKDGKKIIKELTEKNSDCLETIERQKSEIESHVNKISELNEKIVELEKKVENQKLKLNDFEVHLKHTYNPDKLQKARDEEDKIKAFTDLVKENMNTMYQNILEKLFEGDKANPSEIKKSLSHNMKTTTFQIIQEYKNSLGNEKEEVDGMQKNDVNPPPVPEFEVTV